MPGTASVQRIPAGPPGSLQRAALRAAEAPPCGLQGRDLLYPQGGSVSRRRGAGRKPGIVPWLRLEGSSRSASTGEKRAEPACNMRSADPWHPLCPEARGSRFESLYAVSLNFP